MAETGSTSADHHLCAQCKKPADLKCSACRAVSYCSKDHQKAHWKKHKIDCRPFEIQTLEDVGKGLVATKDLIPGDLILSEFPLVIGPRPHIVERGPVPCVGCCRLIIAESSPRCEGCDWPVCHPGCEGLRDPEIHGHECLLLGLRQHRVLDGMHEYYRQDALLALRCLMIQRKGLKKWNQLLRMESHMDKRGKDTEIYKEVEGRIVDYLHQSFLVPMKTLEEQTKHTILPDVTKDTIHRICGIIDINSLEINQDSELSALYPTAYLMEHSCISNTTHSFGLISHGFKITIRAARPIQKGDRITTMYTHALWGTQARREHLRETKYFSCKCQRCSDPTELSSYINALRCIGTENEPCGGIQLPIDPLDDKTEWACSKCPVRMANNDVSLLVNQIGEEVDHVQLKNPTIYELDTLLTKMLTFLHPNHYHVFAVSHSLIQLYGYQQGYTHSQISDELLMRKIKMCRDLLCVTKKIDPGNSRLALYSAVILHELYLANMCLVKRKWDIGNKKQLTESVREAKDAVEKAADVLQYETTTPAGEKLIQLVDNSKKDMTKWIERSKVDFNREF